MGTTANIEGLARRLRTIRESARAGDCTPDDVRWLLGRLDAGEQISLLEELMKSRAVLNRLKSWAEAGAGGAKRSGAHSDTHRAADAGYETAADEVLEILAEGAWPAEAGWRR